MLRRTGDRVVLAVLLAPLAFGCARSPEKPSRQEGAEPEGPPAAPILDALVDLESRRDAKCHSTACRFENFLFGTPLTEEARARRAELLKGLVLKLWREASGLTQSEGRSTVTSGDIEAAAADLIRWETTPEGEVVCTFPSGQERRLPEVRLRQYASISYSLRAVLAAQQDLLFKSDERLPPLAREAVDTLKDTLDRLWPCVLHDADRLARGEDRDTIDPELVDRAWEGLLGPPDTAPEVSGPAPARAVADLDALVERKIAAYEAYNSIPAAERTQRFRKNVQSYYALYPYPQDPAEARAFEEAFDDALVHFSSELLAEAAKRALAAGRGVVRTADADEAVQALMPHRVDDFEDLHFFPNLPRDRQIHIESYDCDAFRDFGRHWRYLSKGLHQLVDGAELRAVPDPFAAEILAEAVSGYAILLLRMAGRVAEESRRSATLAPEHLAEAGKRLRELARENAATEPRPEVERPLVSASGDVTDYGVGRFFTDVTEESGIDFIHRSSPWLSAFRRRERIGLPTFSGGGVAAEDIDADGDPDLLFVGGLGNRLYANDGNGRFQDVTGPTGIDWRRPDGEPGEPRQPLIADLDGDGVQDVIITYVDDFHRAYRGLGAGRFEDVTERANLDGRNLVGGAACLFDYDNDGLLDLYVTYFGDYLHGTVLHQERNNTNALPNRLYRNKGDFRFVLKRAPGAGDTGWAQAVSHSDFDRDGRQDLFVANDFGKNAVLLNRGNGRFVNVAERWGFTPSYHSMNVGVTDINDDGYPDVYVSNIATMVKDDKYVLPDMNTPLHLDPKAMATMLVKEANVLWVSYTDDEGRLEGYRPSDRVERGVTTTGWAWDAEFFDFDLDGDQDLYVVNGSNSYNHFFSMLGVPDDQGGHVFYHLDHDRERNVFYVNEGGRLRNRSPESGADFAGNSRSTAYLDLEGDGDLDIAVNNFHDPATLLRNDSERFGNNWAKVVLVGDPGAGSNREAVGAWVVAVSSEGQRMYREIQCGSGFLSMNPKELHFGLGSARALRLTIHWPSGREESIDGIGANARWRIVEGSGRAERID